MSDFIGDLRDHLQADYDKTERYDEKLTKLFLNAYNISPTYYKKQTGALTLKTLNEGLFVNFACEAYRPKVNVNLNMLLAKKSAIEKADFFKLYTDLKQNYSTVSVFALIFDKHGDAITDLVLHNSATYAEQADWCIRVCVQDCIYFIQSLNSFMVAFTRENNV